MQDNTATLSGFALFANGVAVSVSFKAVNAEGLIRRITSSAANPVLPKGRISTAISMNNMVYDVVATIQLRAILYCQKYHLRLPQ